MKKQLLLLLIFFSAVATYAQRSVTGVVTSAEDGLPIIGASVLVKGTTQGTITDLDGNYSVQVSENSILVFSYVGMEEQQIKVGKQTTINVVMKSSSVQIDEVVVTAMGIKAEKKKLNFAVQSMNADDLTAGKSANFVDALQGRIAGVDISGQGGSPSGKSQIIIRGISSVNPAQQNEPIFILDGVHVSGGASAAAELNPSDIESITVLKGAAAAALYGQEASNGAIMVTTKSAKSGALRVEASATLQVDQAFRVPEIQQMYVNGAQGVYNEKTNGGWGPKLRSGEKVYDNVGNFLQNGFYHKYDISVSGGSEKFNVLASANYSQHNGIIPKDYLDRWGILLKANYNVNKRLSFTALANIVNSESRGFEDGGMKDIYGWPINDDMSYYQEANGDIRWRYIADKRHQSPVNPYYKRYEDTSLNESQRNLIQASMNLKIIKGLELIGRIGYDYANSEKNAVTKRRWDSSADPTEYADEIKHPYYSYGKYAWSDGRSSMFTGTLLLTYEKELMKDFRMNLLIGTEMKDSKGRDAGMDGYDFIVPDVYSLKNVKVLTPSDVSFGNSHKRNYGYYGELKFDYKGLVYFAATIRNDHSSTLNVKDRSYWYPSASGGLVFSELFKLSSDVFSFGKLRGNWAKVGKDAPIYRLNNWFEQKPSFPDGGYGVMASRGTNDKLKPEMMSSWEIGADLRFFDSKTRIDVAYYRTTVENQIVEVRVSPASGNIMQTRNEGSVRNEGLEISWDQSIFRNKNFTWDASLNIGYNRGKVVSLPADTRTVGPSDGYVGTDIKAEAFLGGSTLGITGIDYKRNEAGQILCTADGLPVIDATSKQVGNREPKFTAGFMNRFNWNGWDLSFMFNFRLGGDVVNATSRSLFDSGQHKSLETYRNRKIVIDGVVEQADGTYAKNTTPITFDQRFMTDYFSKVSTNFIEDGSFIRLSYVTLGYDLTKYVKNIGVKGLKCSLTGRNLFLLTKYTGSDPQVNYTGSTGGTGTFGIDNLNVPNTRSFTFNINATF